MNAIFRMQPPNTGLDVTNQLSQQSSPSTPKLQSYKRPKLSRNLKDILGRSCDHPFKIAGYPVKLRGQLLSHHNFLHFEMSCLERILIGKDMVSGIHGFYSHMFHDAPIEAEYEGVLDEARLAVHEWMTRTSFYNTLKLINWSVWFIRQGINPVAVCFRHARSLRRFKQRIRSQSQAEGWFELHVCKEPIQLQLVGQDLKKVNE